MAEKISKNVACPQCSEKSDIELLCSMNSQSQPKMKALVLSDKFFDWTCPKCGYKTQLLHPLLYNDLKNQFMVYYIPKVSKRVVADEKLEQEFAELSDIKKRVVPNVNALKEKVVLLDSHTDDMAMELAKHAVARIVEKSTGQTVHEGYFLEMDKAENTVSFQFFIGAEKRPYIQTTRLEVYNRSLSIVKEYFSDVDKQKGFINIDSDWAKEALKEYKSAQ